MKPVAQTGQTYGMMFGNSYRAVLPAKRWTPDTKRFMLHVSTLKQMERISIDAIGPLPLDMGFKYIIVIIDTFSPYVELFPKQDVTAIADVDALWRHTCRFTAPLELVTDFGSQFVNDLLTHFHQETVIKNHTTIPYSKEENGIVGRPIKR